MIRKVERRRIDSFELWCWRRLLRIPWTARRTNKSVIEEIKATNSLEALIKKQQLSYFGHIMRREKSLEKWIMFGMGGGTRKIGRPRARWLDDIKAVTNCRVQTHRTMWFSKISRCLEEDAHGNHQKSDAT